MSFDSKKYFSQFLKISNDFQDVLKNIKELNDSEIPDRNEQINTDYLGRLKPIFENSDIYFQNSNVKSKNQETAKKSRTEIIDSLLKKLDINPNSKSSILRKIFSQIHGISEGDKQVILMSMENLDSIEIKKSILNIMKAFQ